MTDEEIEERLWFWREELKTETDWNYLAGAKRMVDNLEQEQELRKWLT